MFQSAGKAAGNVTGLDLAEQRRITVRVGGERFTLNMKEYGFFPHFGWEGCNRGSLPFFQRDTTEIARVLIGS
ncbi:hypothetical protein J6590_089772 [Homalodisca vitripennis]|nr:hypothetical protein J6590_089772 [Homalodisca vitripennis]